MTASDAPAGSGQHAGSTQRAVSSGWLLLVAVGLALICYPRFQVLQTVASVPCLAVGAARPGRIYQHPWFPFFFGVDQTGERMRRANAQPGTVIVGYRGAWPSTETIGPYAILRR